MSPQGRCIKEIPQTRGRSTTPWTAGGTGSLSGLPAEGQPGSTGPGCGPSCALGAESGVHARVEEPRLGRLPLHAGPGGACEAGDPAGGGGWAGTRGGAKAAGSSVPPEAAQAAPGRPAHPLGRFSASKETLRLGLGRPGSGVQQPSLRTCGVGLGPEPPSPRAPRPSLSGLCISGSWGWALRLHPDSPEPVGLGGGRRDHVGLRGAVGLAFAVGGACCPPGDTVLCRWGAPRGQGVSG